MIVLIPTELEARYIRQYCPQMEVVICGVGMAEAAATMAHIATTQRPERVILAGIAGVYQHSQIEVGDVVEVVSESIEELPERFGRRYEVEAQWGLPTAHSNSVNSAITITPSAEIENMEGATVMAICERLAIPFTQIRAISNRVGDPFSEWEVERATKALAEALAKIYGAKKMRLNISPCPNDTFMFDAMINGRIDCEGLDLEVAYYDIEELNARALSGEAEFSKISCAIIPQINTRYTISRSGAALGRGNGPLFVRRQGDDSPIRSVAIPGTHTTANLLMQRLFPEITDLRPMLFSTIAEAVERGEVDGGVLIHEGRFLYHQRNLSLVADLGLRWEEQRHLPLPLGAIAIKRELPTEVRERFERVLRRSIEYAFAHPEESRPFIKCHAQEMDDKVIEQHIALFVNDFSIEIGETGARAIEQLTERE